MIFTNTILYKWALFQIDGIQRFWLNVPVHHFSDLGGQSLKVRKFVQRRHLENTSCCDSLRKILRFDSNGLYLHSAKYGLYLVLCNFGGKDMKFSESVKPISYLKQNTAEAIKIVHTNHSPMIITQNGEAKAVLLDVAEYEQDQESLAMLKMIAQSKESYAAGKFKTARKAFSDIRKNIKDTQV